MSLIEFRNINLKQETKVVLQDFNLKLDKGDKVLIRGKSGSGKSTILRILLGFQNFDAGEILFEDRVLEGKDFSVIRNKFAYVDQDISLGQGKISDFLKELVKFKYSGFVELNETAMNYLEFDKVLLEKSIEELSGGERQRLALIIALSLNRDIYLLDEVSSALDSELKIKLANYFSKCDDTVISISHDTVWQETGKFRVVEY